MSGENKKPKGIRWGVFIPAFIIIGGGALLGILRNEWLTASCSAIFSWSLKSFGWLYQLVAVFCLVIVAILTFSKLGNVRFGGRNAKSKHSITGHSCRMPCILSLDAPWRTSISTRKKNYL